MTIEFRRLTADDITGARVCAGRALGFATTEEQDVRLRALLDFDGSFIAVDGTQIAGVVGAYRFGLSTGSGSAEELSSVGTTFVGVLPTHRRQGILRELMRRHIDWSRELGVDAVTLWASEPAIYPRFGFGRATERAGWSIDVRGARPDPTPPEDELRFIERDQIESVIPQLYDAHRAERAGALSRDPTWWKLRCWNDDSHRRGPFGPLQWILARREGRPVGYLQFRRQSIWDATKPQDVVSVEELVGDARARRSLWRFLLQLDLVAEVRAFNLPVDEPMTFRLQNARYAKRELDDGLWLLPLDPARLVTARTFDERSTRLRLRVLSDEPRDLQLVVEKGSAHCEPSSGEPDIILRQEDLPAVAWGDVSPFALLDAGRIEGDYASLRDLGQLFSVPRRAWCPEIF